MVASHMIWLLRTRAIRRRANEADQTFDESEECIQWQAKGVDLEAKFLSLFVKDRLREDRDSLRSDASNAVVAPEHVTPKLVSNALV
jgi:hypothetical protein